MPLFPKFVLIPHDRIRKLVDRSKLSRRKLECLLGTWLSAQQLTRWYRGGTKYTHPVRLKKVMDVLEQFAEPGDRQHYAYPEYCATRGVQEPVLDRIRAALRVHVEKKMSDRASERENRKASRNVTQGEHCIGDGASSATKKYEPPIDESENETDDVRP